jgi:hypothetical protein
MRAMTNLARISRAALCGLTLAASVGSCATTPASAPGAPSTTNLDAAGYYPLDVGWKWAYDLEKDGQKILAMYAVQERTADTATIQAGEERLAYGITPEGVAQKNGSMLGDFVIKNPVKAGLEWPVLEGTAKIAAVGRSITVDAGKFDGCVIVEVTRSSPTRIVRTTFAPGIGPVAIEVQVQMGGEFTTVTRATLRAVTRPGQDPLAQ